MGKGELGATDFIDAPFRSQKNNNPAKGATFRLKIAPETH
jgi:hypothetical protein